MRWDHRFALLVTATLAGAGGAVGLAACVGSAPAGADASADTGAEASMPPIDASADAPMAPVACTSEEDLEVFDDPMSGSGLDLCGVFSLDGGLGATCVGYGAGLGLQYASQELKAAAATTAGDFASFSYRQHQAADPKLERIREAFVTFELSGLELVSPDAGMGKWQSLGCIIDQGATLADGGISLVRVDVATNGGSAAAFAFQGFRIDPPKPLTGFSPTNAMTVTIRVVRRASANTATVSLSSGGLGSTATLDLANGPTKAAVPSQLSLACGAGREGVAGSTKVTVGKIRYARCVAKP